MPIEDKDLGCKEATVIKHCVVGDDVKNYGAIYLLLTKIFNFLIYFTEV